MEKANFFSKIAILFSEAQFRSRTIRNKPIIIAIDGPAASGKSTTARAVARHLGFIYIDTGAMYRSVTLRAQQRGLVEELRSKPERIGEILESLSIRFDGDRIILNDCDVSAAIRANQVSRDVSFISSLKPVRDRMKALQQELGRNGSVVMDGRDIGTVVFPEAELKIFLVADARERAKRRYAELAAKAPNDTTLPDIEQLEAEIRERDRDDAEREHAPLCKHPDAHEIDTSLMSIEQQVAEVLRLARNFH